MEKPKRLPRSQFVTNLFDIDMMLEENRMIATDTHHLQLEEERIKFRVHDPLQQGDLKYFFLGSVPTKADAERFIWDFVSRNEYAPLITMTRRIYLSDSTTTRRAEIWLRKLDGTSPNDLPVRKKRKRRTQFNEKGML